MFQTNHRHPSQHDMAHNLPDELLKEILTPHLRIPDDTHDDEIRDPGVPVEFDFPVFGLVGGVYGG